MSRDLLLEIGTEDLPARYVVPLAEALAQGIAGGLSRRGVAVGASQTFATPRRIAVRLSAVAPEQPEQVIERSGPALATALKDGQPTPAALGFAKSCGVEFSAIGQKDGKLHYTIIQAGKPTTILIAEIFDETLKQMDALVPKRMRWGAGTETFVRPVKWIVCLFGSELVPLQRFGISAGTQTFGHRFHAPDAIMLTAPADYEAKLRAAKVWVDVASRKAEIRRQIEAEARRLNGNARITEDLLDEVTALVEWPTAITGHFEERFLELPPEVIVATVETNQRYFTVFSDAAMTQLTNAFITVSNIESRDVAQVITGNERVVRPRLSDALFFWQQDLQQPLSANSPKLAAVTFQKDLGSTGDRIMRLRALAEHIAGMLKIGADAERAAELCKNDLVSKMVYEFPELQGIMGGYYAVKSGESAAVGRAIREHYLPTQQGTPIPSTVEGQVVALSDKLDALAGIFAIGQKPTASKDPYALRRAALGILRICIEGKLDIDVSDLVSVAIRMQPVPGAQCEVSLIAFFVDRLENYLVGTERAGGKVTPEVFDSARFAESSTTLHPLDVVRRIDAVLAFSRLPEAGSLAVATKRTRNILKQAGAVDSTIDTKLFIEDAERTLFSKLVELEALNAKTADYRTQLLNLASLREPVDAFFDRVMVNADDAAVRANRLALLGRLDALCRSVADLSQLPG
ncbi:MAG: glycine--tRNA ligase subunit beta [Pseudomonadota bacterium]|nr:glycine--tRNA ligase subunit beta [Pseudomonadota bacterium]